MIPLLRQILRTGIVSEAPPDADEALRITAQQLSAAMQKEIGRALVIRHIDAGSCNGCELEIHALNNPYYNLEALGIKFAASPRHADLLLVTGPVAKNIGPERTEAIRVALGLEAGDAAFFVAGDPAKFYKFAGEARNRVGFDLSLVDTERFELCWIVDFPFFEWNEDDKKIDFAHNPFSMPQGGLEALNTQDPLTIKAFQYDMVCNGYEMASGSIRNQSPETMVKAFELTGTSKAEVEERFGGMYRAFQYGAPPHGGMAAGVDRVVMLICGAQNLREITLFPMNQRAEDPLMGAPSPATTKQLRELHIKTNLPN